MAFESSTPLASPPAAGRKYFTLEQANRSLTYVRRVVTDICSNYQQAVRIQQRLEYPLPDDQPDALRSEYEQVVTRLNDHVDELEQVGVELKDYEMGLVDFPAIHEEREVSLCWKLGEEAITAWHETDAGFAGRQNVSLLNPDHTTE